MSDASPTLQLAWWNTGLSPVKSSGQEIESRDSAKWESVRKGVLRLGNLGVDALFLGEVCSDDVQDLKKAAAKFFAHAVKPPRTNTGRPCDIGALVAKDFIAEPFKALSTQAKDKTLDGRQARLRLSANATNVAQITIFAVHWPSRREPIQRKDRMELGSDLARLIQRALRQTTGYVVVLGDFNDEPFDDSVKDSLGSTRMRATARGGARLYNPFWRLLGERRPLESEDEGAPCGGTHRWRGDDTGQWFTLDQILVASAFLGNRGWKLREKSVTILELAELQSGDHFPVMCTLEHVM